MRVIVLDTETASLTQGVVDIAIAVVNEYFDVLWSVESLIDPECPICPEAMGVHHITEEMVWDKPTLQEFMELNEMPLYDVDVVVGHKISFDLGFLQDYLPEQFKTIDTLKLARNAWPDAENHKLQTLRYKFKLDAGDAHRAMGDVITTINLAKRLMAEYGTDFNGLLNLMSAPVSTQYVMPFGAHKGTRICDIPRNYAWWVVNKSDFEPELKLAFSTLL